VARVITVNDVLDGHVVLDVECLDRIYLNAYVPILQTSSQVVAFLSGHLGFPFPSPALFRQMGDRFRKAVISFSDANDIPWIKFDKDEPKLEVMQPHLARLFPLSSQNLAQRPRVGQTAGRPGRDRVHRAVQRVRHLRGPGCPAGDL
jgi:hypothetical protein